MPETMTVYRFPCGETNCYDLATHEFQLTTLEDDYRMPLCAKHAQRLDRVIASK